MAKTAESIIYDPQGNSLRILNQLLLPLSVNYEEVTSAQDAWNAIRQMKVRGAPAIAIVGLLSVAIELGQEETISSLKQDSNQLLDFLRQRVNNSLFCNYVSSTFQTCILVFR